MNAQQKARELVDKYFKPELTHFLFGVLDYETAKQCAIITVDEILEIYRKNWQINNGYWESVRQEIEKL